MQIGVYDDGRVGELFLQMEKATGSFADTTARDVAILISMAIQHGVPIDRMLSAITKDENGRPEGLAGALLAHLKTWAPKEDGWGAAVADTETESAPAGGLSAREQAKSMGFTGDQCSNCNSMKMQVAGHCMVCADCGTTTGCS
jgi:hypothetical protein